MRAALDRRVKPGDDVKGERERYSIERLGE
jgi:hypothetical protein